MSEMSESERTIVSTTVYCAWDAWVQEPTYVAKVCLKSGDEYCCSSMTYEGGLAYGRAYTGRKTTDDPKFEQNFIWLSDWKKHFPLRTAVWMRTAESGIGHNVMPTSSDERSFDILSMDEWLKDDVSYAVLRWNTFVANEVKPAERVEMARPTVANMVKYLTMKGLLRPFLEHEMSAFIEDVLAGEIPQRPNVQPYVMGPLCIPPSLKLKLDAYCCERNETLDAVITDLLKEVVSDWENTPSARAALSARWSEPA